MTEAQRLGWASTTAPAPSWRASRPAQAPRPFHLTPAPCSHRAAGFFNCLRLPTMPSDQDKPRRAGRPRSTDPRTMRGMRLTALEWSTYQALGGNTWLSAQLARARLSPEQKADRDRRLAGTQQALDLDPAK